MLKTRTNEAQDQKDLKKLQALCEASNNKYSKGLNDDDQIRKIFDFAKKNGFCSGFNRL